MTSIARYFLGNECLGESVIETKVGRPYSWAFFCSTCGELWARVWVEDSSVWKAIERPCEQHKGVGVWDIDECPGSLLNHITSKHVVGSYAWAIVLEHLPRGVLLRELLLMLHKVENNDGPTPDLPVRP